MLTSDNDSRGLHVENILRSFKQHKSSFVIISGFASLLSVALKMAVYNTISSFVILT